VLVVLASLKSNTGNKTKNVAQCFFYLKEKKLICYLDPKPNAYIKKIATSCQKAEKITVPNFFIKSFPLQNNPQPSLSSWGCAVFSFFIFYLRNKIRESDFSHSPLIQKSIQLSKFNRTRVNSCPNLNFNY